jgi:hypothetical protein
MPQLRWRSSSITRIVPLLLLLLLALALPAPAAASHAGGLWATVNICDTADNPNILGVRASMPGNATEQTMWMRFRVSYFDRATERWRNVEGGRSPWVKVGDARYRTRQGGRKFRIDPPAPVTSYVVRGLVDFQWRRPNGKVRRRARQKTLSGHRTGRHGDPRGYTAGVCEITFP